MRALAIVALFGMLSFEAVPAEPLGRLFYTPPQRAQLDLARSQRSRATLANESTEAQSVPEVVTVNGAVRRSDGKSTIWINNKPVAEGDRRGAVSVAGKNADGSVTLQTNQTERGVSLKVGQSVEVLSGRIEEPYSRQATAPKPEPKPVGSTPKTDVKPSAASAAVPARPGETARAAERRREDEAMDVARLRAAAEAERSATQPAASGPPR